MKTSPISKVRYILTCYFYLSVVLLFVPIFINFDSHHDGLILSTTLELRRALENGGEWPFNQYGQLWAFPFALLSFLVDDQYLLLSMRLLTFLFYLATAYLIHRVSGRFLRGVIVQVPVFLYLLAQPFALGLNSTFLPWPSALCVLLITLVLERLTTEPKSSSTEKTKYIVSGILVLLILGTRFQVGAIMLTSIAVLLICHHRFKETVLFLAGFSFSLTLACAYFASMGWLGDSLLDSIVFSSQYVTGDTSTYPVPRVTILFSLLAILCIFIIDIASRKNSRPYVFSNKAFFAVSAVLVACIFGLSLLSTLSFSTWTTLFIRRMWISVSIAFLVYAVLSIGVTAARKRNLFEPNNFHPNILLLISLCSFTQIAPLFDQMHFWWGFSPLVIFLVYIVQAKLPRVHFAQLHIHSSLVLASTFLLLMNIVGVSKQIDAITEPMESTIGAGIYLNDATDNRISKFLNNNVAPDSKVLSLCPNSNAIFSLKSSKSAIREFVLWSPTLDFTFYKESFLAADFDYLIACPLGGAVDFGQAKINESINQILQEYQLVKVESLLDVNGRTWTIYITSK
jgi:hypothetical protein